MSAAHNISEGSSAQPRRDAKARKRLPSRHLRPTERADLVVSWHRDKDEFVLTLWHDQVCVGSAPLSPSDAAELGSFLVTQLGERSAWMPRLVSDEPRRLRSATVGARWLLRLRRLLRGARR